MEQSLQKVRSRHQCLSGATLMLLLVPWLLLAPHLTAQDARERVHGAKVRLLQNEGADLRGELLALHDGRVWVLSDRGVIEQAPLALVREVRIQRHDWPARRILIWTGVAGGLTSAGMFSACVSQSETGDCVVFALGWAGAWTGIGALSGLLVRPSEQIRPGRFGELRAYARFPQGPPEGYLPGTDADPRTFAPEATEPEPREGHLRDPLGPGDSQPFRGSPGGCFMGGPHPLGVDGAGAQGHSVDPVGEHVCSMLPGPEQRAYCSEASSYEHGLSGWASSFGVCAPPWR